MGLIPLVYLIPSIYLGAVSPLLVRVDLREHRLPNRVVLPAIALGLLACAGEWMLSGRIPAVPLVAALAYSGFLLVFSLLGGMGMGDVKLAAALGLASQNLSVAILSPVLAFLAGGIASVVLLLSGRRGRIAFGPFLLGGFWCAIALDALACAVPGLL
jgi:leader peptidase (prepilin peptidase) / N-methyltransferase